MQVCVCVWLREREREMDGQTDRHGNSDLENQSNVASSGSDLAVTQQSASIPKIKPKTKIIFNPWRN